MAQLTTLQITNAKPQEKPYRPADGDGLSLLIYPNGSKLWQLRCRISGKANIASRGKFPFVSFKEAREQMFTLKQDYILLSQKPPSRAQQRLGKRDAKGERVAPPAMLKFQDKL